MANPIERCQKAQEGAKASLEELMKKVSASGCPEQIGLVRSALVDLSMVEEDLKAMREFAEGEE